MSKKLVIEHNGKEYKLEFTKDSVRLAENRGLKIKELLDYPSIQIPLLVQGAFIAHNKWMRSNEIMEIYEDLPDKHEFIEKLAEMYNEPVEELLGLGEDANEGKKGTWEATF